MAGAAGRAEGVGAGCVGDADGARDVRGTLRVPPDHVVGWSRYDGTGRTRPTTGDSDEPPYPTGLAALQDGWRLFQASQLLPPQPVTSTTSPS
jgi:hypothetical protein